MRLHHLLFILFQLLSLLPCNTDGAAASNNDQRPSSNLQQQKKNAYVTLLYAGHFDLAIRTLGKSLRDTGTKADMIVLVTPNIGQKTRDILADDGWLIREVQPIENPSEKSWVKSGQNDYIFTKLEIFRLLEYDKVVYLDGDIVVFDNIDELFLCGPFCAIMRHSELFNGGVLVVKPNEDTYKDLVSKVDVLYSYDGGDQGFLNSYFEDFASCPYFDPKNQDHVKSMEVEDRKIKNRKHTHDEEKRHHSPDADKYKNAKCCRLPHRYNGDWPLAMLNGRITTVNTKNPETDEFLMTRKAALMHYTVGPIKPWNWYSSAIFPYCHLWSDVADTLYPPSKERTRYLLVMWLILAPLGLVGLLVYYYSTKNRQGGGASSSLWTRQLCSCSPSSRNNPLIVHLFKSGDLPVLSLPALLCHILGGYTSLLLGLGVGYTIVPTTIKAEIGWTIFLLYALGTFFALYGSYLYWWYLAGATQHGQQVPLKRSQALTETTTYASLLVLIVTTFVYQSITTRTVGFGQVIPGLVVMGVSMLIGLTFVFLRLPLIWYTPGGRSYEKLPVVDDVADEEGFNENSQ